jgi:hypothetical protein
LAAACSVVPLAKVSAPVPNAVFDPTASRVEGRASAAEGAEPGRDIGAGARRPQIVPWSILCRADWVRNDLGLPMGGAATPLPPQFLWEMRETMRSSMGVAKRRRLRVDQPTILDELTQLARKIDAV